MEKQKAKMVAFFKDLGYDETAAEAMAVSFLTPKDGEDPALDTSALLLQAQKYAKPLLEKEFLNEHKPRLKGQYHGEAVSKIVTASKNKLKREDYEGDGGLEKAIAALEAAIRQEVGASDTEKDTTINHLREQISTLTTEKDSAVESVRSEYAEKENGRQVFDTLLSKLGQMQNPGEGKIGKKLTVDQAHAARGVLRDLSDNYILKYDEATKGVALYDKANPGQKATLQDGSKFVQLEDLLEKTLTANNWIAQSNGAADPIKKLGNMTFGNPSNPNKDVAFPDQRTKALADNISKYMPQDS